MTGKVLEGSHYARSVQGFNYLAEALHRLQFIEFFTEERLKKYEQIIISIIMMKENFENSAFDEALDTLKDFRSQ